MDDLAGPITNPPTSASGSTRALVYVGDEDSEGVIRQALGDLGVSEAVFRPGGMATAIADRADRASPRLLIVEIGKVQDPAAKVAELIAMCDPTTGVVAIGDSNDITLYRAIKNAGAAEYFFKPLVTALLAQTCNAVLTGQRAPDQAQRDMEARRGRLILVLGVRGGVGATTMAVRTAWRLADNPPRSVVMVDLDLQFGDAALQLDAAPNHALREALERADRVDELFLERGIVHITKRLDLLASLEPLEDSIHFEEEAILSLLDILRQRYRYIVMDLPPLRAVGLPRLLHTPGLLMLVSDGGLASAREVARMRQLLGANTPERTILHVLNKSGGPGSLPLPEFIRGAGESPDVVVPWSRDIAIAANLGVKLKPECPPLDHALAPVFARLSGRKAPPARSLLSRLMG